MMSRDGLQPRHRFGTRTSGASALPTRGMMTITNGTSLVRQSAAIRPTSCRRVPSSKVAVCS